MGSADVRAASACSSFWALAPCSEGQHREHLEQPRPDEVERHLRAGDVGAGQVYSSTVQELQKACPAIPRCGIFPMEGRLLALRWEAAVAIS